MPAAEHLRVAVPKPEIPRPTLPTEVNPHITSTMDGTSDPPSVQFQVLFRDGIAVTLARVKVRTPGGPVYILRRMDTGAISVTTMFRAAFPTASEEAAEAENNWIKLSFAAADQSGRPHLPGHWVTPDVALYLAEGYHLSGIVCSLASAVLDPNLPEFKEPEVTPHALAGCH